MEETAGIKSWLVRQQTPTKKSIQRVDFQAYLEFYYSLSRSKVIASSPDSKRHTGPFKTNDILKKKEIVDKQPLMYITIS